MDNIHLIVPNNLLQRGSVTQNAERILRGEWQRNVLPAGISEARLHGPAGRRDECPHSIPCNGTGNFNRAALHTAGAKLWQDLQYYGLFHKDTANQRSTLPPPIMQ